MAVLPPVHHVVAVLVAGYCVGSVELGSVSVEQTLDISNSELAVHRICDCLANTEKNRIISCHGCHIWKIPKFRFRSSEFKFKFKSRCRMGPFSFCHPSIHQRHSIHSPPYKIHLFTCVCPARVCLLPIHPSRSPASSLFFRQNGP